jgi:hypothetical protein
MPSAVGIVALTRPGEQAEGLVFLPPPHGAMSRFLKTRRRPPTDLITLSADIRQHERRINRIGFDGSERNEVGATPDFAKELNNGPGGDRFA